MIRSLIFLGFFLIVSTFFGTDKEYKKVEKLVWKNKLSSIQSMVEKGYDINKKFENGESILTISAQYGRNDIIEYIVGQGADLEIREQFGYTPLLNAIESGYFDTVELLLRLGSDLFAVTTDHYSAVYLAVDNGHLELVKYLIEKGAEIDHPDYEGLTPLLLATLPNERAENIPVYDTIAKTLINRGANINAIAGGKISPLINTIISEDQNERSNIHTFRILIENGADHTIVCNECCNASVLYYAVNLGSYEMVQTILIKGGIDINARQCEGNTPLHGALIRKPHPDKLAIIKELVMQGVDISLKNNNGQTALDIAYSTDDEALIAYMESL